jgi:hypothetical protein
MIRRLRFHDRPLPLVPTKVDDDKNKPTTLVLDRFPALDDKLQRAEHSRALAELNQRNREFWGRQS